MSAPIIVFFNNKGGVGNTSLVYHLSWMYCDLGLQVLAADLDPQANLTATFLDDDRLEEIWDSNDANNHNTIFRCVQPLLRGIGDITSPQLEEIDNGLNLLVGDLQLSGFEDELSAQWLACLDGQKRALKIISAFWRLLSQSAAHSDADVVLVDLGPTLGAINRAALIAADYVVVPLSPDLLSLQGLKNLGPTLKRWRGEWQRRLPENLTVDLPLPKGNMQPIGYVILQHGVRFDRPVQAFQTWMARIPHIYKTEILQTSLEQNITPAPDPHRLALLKHYQGLMPMAQEAHKPIFHLKPADGAIGAHSDAVRRAYQDFRALALELAHRTELPLTPHLQSS